MWCNPDGKNLLVIDLETTDIAVAEACGHFPEIIEVGACLIDRSWDVVGTWSSFIRPLSLDKVTEFTTELTGITQDDVAEAPFFPAVMLEMRKFMGAEKASRLAHFGPSDSAWLRSAYLLHGLSWPFLGWSLCLQSLAYGAAAEWGFDFHGFSLADVAERLGVEAVGAHRAAGDACTAAGIFLAIATGEISAS